MELIQPVAYYFGRFLRYLMPRKPTIQCPHPALSPLRGTNRDSESQSFETWSRCLSIYYHNTLVDRKDWVVKEMRWFKNRNRLEHEYIVFVVQKSDDPTISLFLRFDRRSSSTALEKEKTNAVVRQEDYEVTISTSIPLLKILISLIYYRHASRNYPRCKGRP